MPSITHEGMLQPFENRPALAAELLTDTFAVKLPAWRHARVGSAELTEVVPAVRRADLAVVLWDGDRSVLAVIVEVQLRRDERKRFTWPLYLASLRARLECPVMLLVVCPSVAAAESCADPIEMGHPEWVLRPLVLGPGQVPVVTDADQARRSPELAVLSALAHGSDRRRRGVLAALVAALQVVDRDRAEVYHDVVAAVLPQAARRFLEGLMSTKTYQFQSEFALSHIARGRAEGEARGRVEGEARGRVEGEARAVLVSLAARGIGVPDEARERITACTDLDQLDTWIRRAATAGSIDDLFVE